MSEDLKDFVIDKGEDSKTGIIRFDGFASSNLKKVFYDKKRKILCVVFQNGTGYSYKEVDEDIMQKMMVAKSQGSFFMSQIKGRYKYDKIDKASVFVTDKLFSFYFNSFPGVIVHAANVEEGTAALSDYFGIILKEKAYEDTKRG